MQCCVPVNRRKQKMQQKKTLGVPLPADVRNDFDLLSRDAGITPATNARILIVAYINENKSRLAKLRRSSCRK